ncbi:hypothetical protein AD940_02545 [Gluconobacter thailandicus]|uniref:alpha/beta hydrolase n=1 Tax=Gluconobacter thailandicus TaxID=257438 RepID=UPI000777B807|nr:alpha/beta hydrolase-fold protein [Gluconobacter thailandicus]KXV35519.1 hypothetical protein AD940_02545 [Gluconobacter thailandicus]
MRWGEPETASVVRYAEFTSRLNERAYALSVALPPVPPGPEGYRVLYVLDGSSYFATAMEAVRLNTLAEGGVVVVGIGYPQTADFVCQTLGIDALPEGQSLFTGIVTAHAIARLYDLTLPASQEQLDRFVFDLLPLQECHVGGASGFLQVIEEEIKPRIAELVPVNSADQTLFGHSLGGLVALHALFTRPESYRTFLISSPSIWWSRCSVLSQEAAFSALVERGEVSPRVQISVGAEEDDLPPLQGRSANEQDRIRAMYETAHMIPNAHDVTARLRSLRGGSGYTVSELAVFEKQSHGLSPWPAIGRGVSFAYLEATS